MEAITKSVGKLTSAFERLGSAIETATAATEKAQGTLDAATAHRRKSRWPLYRVRSRKQRIRIWRQRRRRIANEMHYSHGELIQAYCRGEKEFAAEITRQSAAYLVDAVARITVLRYFEMRFSGPAKHVIRSLNFIRKKHKSRHSPFTGESGHFAIRHSFLARLDAERARIDKLKSAAGAGFGVIV